MNIQWMLFARAFRFRLDNSLLDIAGVFERVTLDGPPYTPEFVVLAKVNYGPRETGTITTFTVKIGKPGTDHWTKGSLSYTYPQIGQWTENTTPYVWFDVKIEFPEVGMHLIQIIHDGDVVAEESFIVRDAKEAGNA